MLPDKTIRLSYSLLGIGATLLKKMDNEDTISSLWERVKGEEMVNTYEKFIRGLLVLYSLGAIAFENEILKKIPR